MHLGQLIALNGFTTDASEPGVERLAVSQTRPSAGLLPQFDICAEEIDKELSGLLNPHQLIFCKGWTRSFCCQTVLLVAYKNQEFLDVCAPIFSKQSVTLVAIAGLFDTLQVKCLLATQAMPVEVRRRL